MDERGARIEFVFTSNDYRQNWSTRSTITNLLYKLQFPKIKGNIKELLLLKAIIPHLVLVTVSQGLVAGTHIVTILLLFIGQKATVGTRVVIGLLNCPTKGIQ